MEDLARSLSNAVKGIPDLFKHGVNVSVAGFGFGIGASEEHPDSVSIIEDILKALKKKEEALNYNRRSNP